MKKFYRFLGVIVASASLLVGCNDEETLDLAPINPTEANFYSNFANLNSATLGVYHGLTNFHIWWGQRIMPQIALLPSDDLSNTNNPSDYDNPSQLNPGTNRLGNHFQTLYQVVNRANTLLFYLEDFEPPFQISQEQVDALKGEGMFLRAYMHYKAWVVYGTAPVVTERIEDISVANDLTNSVGSELLDAAVADLENAINLLPESWDASNTGRVTKNSARGLLIKALMARGTAFGQSADFNQVITVFPTITAQLTASYGENFEFATENNIESLFEWQSTGRDVNSNGWYGPGANQPAGNVQTGATFDFL